MAYVAPAILSLQATSAFAKNGSLKPSLPTKIDVPIPKVIDAEKAAKTAEKRRKERPKRKLRRRENKA